jgi:catechol 2,3-dioxygenase-like lactoylglutathione lyase family enzyme
MLADARVEATIPVLALDRAREFYGGVLGLRPAGTHNPEADALFECGQGSRLMVYQRASSSPSSPHTVAHFEVDDVEATVRELRGRGVEFDDYDLPTLKTVNGVATAGDMKFAWFHDPDDNVIGIHN